MCGIVGAVAQRDVAPILLEGLKRLEYRGYDSAGMAVLDADAKLACLRAVGKVRELDQALAQQPLPGCCGVAHTRWATHGRPSLENAHPHLSHDRIAVVHNGIIENHEALRAAQLAAGFRFQSETDTEVIAHQIYLNAQSGADLLQAVLRALKEMRGAYAIGVLDSAAPGRLIAARRGSPLVIGLGIGEFFIASDVAALVPVTQRFIFLEEGDIADLGTQGVAIYDADGAPVTRPVHQSELVAAAVERGHYRHYMHKEIFEQPRALADTLEGRVHAGRLLEECFGYGAAEIFDRIREVQIVACGTSYLAGSVGRYWLEALAGVPCTVDVASEFRYRHPVVRPDTLIVAISQSGETADTLAALKEGRRLGCAASLALCNMPESSLTRAAELVFLTRAGPELSVASTKAFTTQLVALMLLTIALGRRHKLDPKIEARLIAELVALPGKVERALEQDAAIAALAERFVDKQHALFLGRGMHYPVAMEAALKLKEISYIHAEAYPAGELKHGPLALIDANMPVVAVAPNDELLEKLKSNLQEVRARGGQLIVFADPAANLEQNEQVTIIPIAPVVEATAPVVFIVPLQLLAYHVAVLRGTDVDQPRNLAKSVTVE